MRVLPAFAVILLASSKALHQKRDAASLQVHADSSSPSIIDLLRPSALTTAFKNDTTYSQIEYLFKEQTKIFVHRILCTHQNDSFSVIMKSVTQNNTYLVPCNRVADVFNKNKQNSQTFGASSVLQITSIAKGQNDDAMMVSMIRPEYDVQHIDKRITAVQISTTPKHSAKKALISATGALALHLKISMTSFCKFNVSIRDMTMNGGAFKFSSNPLVAPTNDGEVLSHTLVTLGKTFLESEVECWHNDTGDDIPRDIIYIVLNPLRAFETHVRKQIKTPIHGRYVTFSTPGYPYYTGKFFAADCSKDTGRCWQIEVSTLTHAQVVIHPTSKCGPIKCKRFLRISGSKNRIINAGSGQAKLYLGRHDKITLEYENTEIDFNREGNKIGFIVSIYTEHVKYNTSLFDLVQGSDTIMPNIIETSESNETLPFKSIITKHKDYVVFSAYSPFATVIVLIIGMSTIAVYSFNCWNCC